MKQTVCLYVGHLCFQVNTNIVQLQKYLTIEGLLVVSRLSISLLGQSHVLSITNVPNPTHDAGMDYIATKGNHDSNCYEGGGDAGGCSDNNNKDRQANIIDPSGVIVSGAQKEPSLMF